jgi:hypothetical protein
MRSGNIVWVDFRAERYRRDVLSWKERVERRAREFSSDGDREDVVTPWSNPTAGDKRFLR